MAFRDNTMYYPSQSYRPAQYGESGLEHIAYSAVSYAAVSSASGGGYRASSLPFSAGTYRESSAGSAAGYGTGHGNGYGTAAKNDYAASSVQYLMSAPQAEYHFIPDDFLKPGKEGKFVGAAEEIREFVEEAFARMLDAPFPSSIKISVLDGEQFRALAPHPATVGLSINRRQQGLLSEIFVLNDSIGKVMLTVGHELGHVLTPTLGYKQDEEAKAYAFSLMWMKAIKEHNIAGLADAIVTECPAENGLHNVAFEFVEKLLKAGKKAGEIYTQLIRKILSVNGAVVEE